MNNVYGPLLMSNYGSKWSSALNCQTFTRDCIHYLGFIYPPDVNVLTESDQELYKNFPIVISERWQQEITETVFDTVNQETDKIEQKRRTKFKQNNIYDDEKTSDLILQGQLKKNTGTFGFSWQIRYTKLYPNRLELHYEKGDKDPEVYTMERIEHIDSKEVKGQKTITIHLKGGNEPRLMLSPQ
ncbi:unnamed protein product, partial [Adineta steineri]